MVTKFVFGQGFLNADAVYYIDSPNADGGIGDATAHGWFWTGETWLGRQVFRFHFGAVNRIETRSNENETDEEWKVLWERPEKFEYKAWHDAAKLLNEREKEKELR